MFSIFFVKDFATSVQIMATLPYKIEDLSDNWLATKIHIELLDIFLFSFTLVGRLYAFILRKVAVHFYLCM